MRCNANTIVYLSRPASYTVLSGGSCWSQMLPLLCDLYWPYLVYFFYCRNLSQSILCTSSFLCIPRILYVRLSVEFTVPFDIALYYLWDTAWCHQFCLLVLGAILHWFKKQDFSFVHRGTCRRLTQHLLQYGIEHLVFTFLVISLAVVDLILTIVLICPLMIVFTLVYTIVSVALSRTDWASILQLSSTPTEGLLGNLV